VVLYKQDSPAINVLDVFLVKMYSWSDSSVVESFLTTFEDLDSILSTAKITPQVPTKLYSCLEESRKRPVTPECLAIHLYL
jgi:hypothetical protein